METIVDLLRESDYWAGREGREVVGAADVKRAVEAQEHREGRLRDLLREQIVREIVLIDTDGERVGQINGLSVFQIGRSSFGKPTRITARVRPGRGSVVDIEREVKLGGPLHSKGVLILTGFLGAHYAPKSPLALSASLVFEQSYGGVEGDSASLAETCSLLSAVAEVPLKQHWAVTGSVNQLGQVQAIGGVNEKIEGFFDVCQARGLTGRQGVIIPRSNVKHLMLRDDVVAAAEAGQFRVVAVETVDDALSLLTEKPAGARGPDGTFPEGSFNRIVDERLAALAELARRFALGPEDHPFERDGADGKRKPKRGRGA
jgi:predicted ATP-dependent protease